MRIAALIVLTTILCACGGNRFSPSVLTPSSFARGAVIRGNVTGAGRPLAGSRVTLYRAGSNGARGGAVAIASARTDSRGKFSIRYGGQPSKAVLYLVALGGNAGVGTNAAIGLLALAPTDSSTVTINEFSTVAVAYALAQFSDNSGETIGASATNSRGIANAVDLARNNLVTSAGSPAAFWPRGNECSASSASPDNCEGLERLDGLANAVAACVFSKGATSSSCTRLFGTTHPIPRTTLAAVHAIALDPSRNAGAIYALAQFQVFQPIPPAAPDAWTLALKYVGNGKEFDGPGNIAVDERGNVWITNNYVYNADPSVAVCGGKQLLELTPLGNDAFRAPFSGGGINGAGFGITIDLRGHTWAGNFGFSGKGCKYKPPGNSVSEFASSGRPLSPPKGFQQRIDAPQGMAVDRSGTVWIVNNGNGSVTRYLDASPQRAHNTRGVGLRKPFDVAIDGSGNAWVTGTFSNNVVELAPDGSRVGTHARRLNSPLGIAVDSKNRVWVNNEGGNSVALIASGTRPPFSGGGIDTPWGIAIDGNDNAWIANFNGTAPRISELCGGSPGACPRGRKLGQPISPKAGYTSALLTRLTGVAVDASGNLWVADNWQAVPLLTNPGGNAVVEFVGIAAPVKTPLIGPPLQP